MTLAVNNVIRNVRVSDNTGLVAVVILTDGWTEGLWEQYCLNIATFALTTETHRQR